MNINLLQSQYDKHTEMFIDGLIDYEFYKVIEMKFLLRCELFTISLN
jgi:hypothetical protein